MEPRVFETRVTRMLGIEHPIVQGGMMWVSQPALVAAVSNAGGLGILTALTYETPAGLERAIAATRALTDRPFGVNLTFLPTLVPKDYGGLIDVMVGEGIPIIETAGRNPEPYLERLKAGKALVIHKCTAVRFARKAQSIGCDLVSIDGFECAGHPGEDDVTSLVLIPLTVDAVDIPVVASGGFADARGLVAALSLGAEAVNMGTRFVATAESPVHPSIKQWLASASERDTMFVMRSLRNTERVLRNAAAEQVAELEQHGASIAELAPLISGKNGLRMVTEGDTQCGLMSAGQCVGLVRDAPAVGELVDRIMREARAIVDERFGGMRTAAPA
ncbi:MAG TPA: nitronate monooxygenase [Thermoanaerobaculales bacterium]|nr:nitronate monooxygenase [Thermoanaerobaculales bacterium]